MEETATLQVRLKAPSAQLTPELTEGDTGFTCTSITRTRSRDPLTDARMIEIVIAVVAGTAAVIGMRLFRIWERQRERGMIIDLTGDEPEFSLIENVPYGTVVVKEVGGKPQIHDLRDKPQTEFISFVEGLLGAGKAVGG